MARIRVERGERLRRVETYVGRLVNFIFFAAVMKRMYHHMAYMLRLFFILVEYTPFVGPVTNEYSMVLKKRCRSK
jgi:hypothetical protein